MSTRKSLVDREADMVLSVLYKRCITNEMPCAN